MTDSKNKRRRRWGLALAIGSLLAIPAGIFGLRFGYEHARYEVEEQASSFEVRRYAPRVVAEVTVSGEDAKVASSRGFRILADYIFGNNVAGRGIAMTTPVAQQASERVAMTTPVDVTEVGASWTVRFTMPSEYRLEDLPTPRDARVRLRAVAGERFAAARFSGRAKPARFEAERDALLRSIDAAGHRTRDGVAPVYAQYDPPWTPALLRRNEVMVALAE